MSKISSFSTLGILCNKVQFGVLSHMHNLLNPPLLFVKIMNLIHYALDLLFIIQDTGADLCRKRIFFKTSLAMVMWFSH